MAGAGVEQAFAKQGDSMKTYGLLALNIGSALVGFAESLDWVSLLGSQQAGVALSAIALANLVLRSLKPSVPAA